MNLYSYAFKAIPHNLIITFLPREVSHSKQLPREWRNRNQAAREGLAARRKFAKAKSIWSWASTFLSSRNRVFLKRNCPLTTLNLASNRGFAMLDCLSVFIGWTAALFLQGVRSCTDHIVNLIDRLVDMLDFFALFHTCVTAVTIDFVIAFLQ